MDLDQYIRFLLALVVVLILIVLTIWLLKRVGMFTAGGGINTRKRRLSVVEAIPLDTRRRLVLVRRDGIEHLLLLGTNGDLVVEAAIGASFTDNLGNLDEPPAKSAAPAIPLAEAAPPVQGEGSSDKAAVNP